MRGPPPRPGSFIDGKFASRQNPSSSKTQVFQQGSRSKHRGAGGGRKAKLPADTSQKHPLTPLLSSKNRLESGVIRPGATIPFSETGSLVTASSCGESSELSSRVLKQRTAFERLLPIWRGTGGFPVLRANHRQHPRRIESPPLFTMSDHAPMRGHRPRPAFKPSRSSAARPRRP